MNRKTNSARPRSDRSRLVQLGIALVLIVLAIQVAADPATWMWLFPGSTARHHGPPTLEDITYDVSLPDETQLRPDEFRTESIRKSPDLASEQAAGTVFDPKITSGIEDDTLTLSKADLEAYYSVLERLRTRDADDLAHASDNTATFPAVMTEPDHFRGKIIAIQGLAKRILEMPAGANPYGFETLYELWVFTPDSGNNPWRVVATDLPAGLPRGLLENGVTVHITGIFFKRQGYETQAHALHVAPLLLAGKVRRVQAVVSPMKRFNVAPWLSGAAAILGTGVLLLLLRFRREDRLFEKSTLERLAKSPPDALNSVSVSDDDDPAHFFRALASAAEERRESQ